MMMLQDVIVQSLVLCYKEDVGPLVGELAANGLNPSVLRASYNEEQLRYPANTRTFMSHRSAWERATENPGYTLICEADFVPCTGLGQLPVFWPMQNARAWGYLYQGSPRLLSIVGPERYLRGHCAPLVAYVVNPEVARVMLLFFDHEMSARGTENYFTFDAHLQWWVMGQGAEAYIPMRHYGEHGGLPNREHASFGRLNRAGHHRADNLAGPLAFLPHYAGGRRHTFMIERMTARAYGWARLLTGKWIVDTNVYSRDLRKTALMNWIGFRRLLA